MAIVSATEPVGSPNLTATRVGKAAGIMMGAILASRILALVRNAVISGEFGQGYEADTYTAAFMVPDLLFYLIAGGALSSAFIPVFTEKITHGKEEEASHVFSTVACVMLVVASIFLILTEVFAPQLIKYLNFGFEPDKVAATVPLTRIVLPAQIFFLLGGLLMGVQYARQRFLIPAMGPLVYNVGIIVGGVALAGPYGIAGLCWGALIGALVGNFALQAWGVSKTPTRFRLSFDWKHPDVVKVWKLIIPVVLGLALPQVSIIINRMYASTLGHGAQTAINNANQLMQVPLGIFAQAMGVAILPTLSALHAQAKFTELRATASAGIRTLLFLTIPASVFMIVLAVPIIRLLLEHGKFTAADTPVTAAALTFYAIGIFAWSAHAVLSKSFYAMQDSRTPVLIGSAVTLVFIPLNGLFMTTFGLGIRGLALATTVAATLHMSLTLLVLRKRLKGIEGGRLLLGVARILVASALAGGACWAVMYGLERGIPFHSVKLQAFVTVAAGLVVGLLVYLVVSYLLKSDELRQVLTILQRRKKPPALPPTEI